MSRCRTTPSPQRRRTALLGIYPSAPEDIDELFARLAVEGFDAAYIWSTPFCYLTRKRIADLALQNRVPTISESTDYAREGVLLTYGQDLRHLIEGSAEYIDKLFRGTQPSDLPLRQPTKARLAC